MSEILKKRMKQTADFVSPVDEAAFNLMIAADYVQTKIDRFCAEFGITRGQYNVLRILRGAGAEGLARWDIAERMLERAPDVTRIIDRLEKQNLVLRERSSEDKRQSITQISEKGLELLIEIQPKVDETRDFLSKLLSLPEWIALSSLCEKIYDEKK